MGRVLLGQFRVDAFIASGGMGAVYRVWDLMRNVPLAMKVLNAELADDPSVFKRFQREARALKKLAHPNIVPFYGLYQAEGVPFLLERFIDGSTLKDILGVRKGKPLPVEEALEYLKAIGAALGYAHANGVVHCDVKPGNVMVDRGGNIYLTDFGIARHAESTTTTLATIGTAAYMAPEQVRGESVTPETDIYALGVMAFELLTGQRPFRGTESGTEGEGTTANERIRIAHLKLAPPDPRNLNPSLSEGLAMAIIQALQKEPAQRPSSVMAYYTALEQASLTMPAGETCFKPAPKAYKYPDLKGYFRTHAGVTFLSVVGIALLLIILSLRSRSSLSSVNSALITEGTKITQAISPSNTNTSAPDIQATTNAVASITQTVVVMITSIHPTVTLAPLDTSSIDITSLYAIPPKVDIPEYQPAGDCYPSRIHIGDLVFVTYGGGKNAIRRTPDTHPSNNIIGNMYPGDTVDVLDGPVCNYKWVLWYIRSVDGMTGWTPEGDKNNFWLQPIIPWQACQDSHASRLQVGDFAYVSFNPPDPNTVRVKGAKYATEIGKIQPGEKIEIIDGPDCSGKWVWWKIRSQETNLTGWTAEGDTQNYFLVPYFQVKQ
jgi:serine/threonine protein kinase